MLRLGYWNYFTPMFDYTDLRRYTASIRQFVEDGLLKYPSELYYPVRLKPGGEYSLEALLDQGVDHIELRMFDLNPLVPVGVDVRDVLFAQFLLVWLAGTPRQPLPKWAQVQAVQNFKNAAHYDLKTVNIVLPEGDVYSVIDAGLCVLSKMQEFYRDFPKEVQDILEFERAKFADHTNRYAWKVRQEFEGGFVKKGVDLAKERQKEAKL